MKLNDAGGAANAANAMPLDPSSFLVLAAAAFPDHVAVVHGDRTLTYAELLDRCASLASALRRAGVAPGDVVSLMATNTPEAIELHYAVMMAGAVLNPLNTRLNAPLIAFILDHAESSMLITDTEFADAVGDALTLCNTSALAVVDIIDPEYDGEHTRVGSIDYEALVAAGDPAEPWPGVVDELQAIFLSYTSGTTGAPKGVVSNARQIYLNSLGQVAMWALPRHPVYLWTLPMFHAVGWCAPYSMVVMAGTHVCLRTIDPKAIGALIERHGVTHLCAAPIVLSTLFDHSTWLPKDTVHVLTAGSAPPRAVLEEARRRGFNVLHVYGMTEAGGVQTYATTSTSMPDDQFSKFGGRQGVAIATLQGGLRVADPTTCEPVPQDGETMGEILLRGNTLMSGYLKNAAATSEAFSGGWLHTGDLAVWHEGGQVEIKDRSKDIIISGGENVSSIEVEEALLRHPAINDAAVVAGPHHRWGETPVAFVTSSAELSEAEVIAHCREHLAHYKCPTSVVFATLPRTPTGKIQKYLLRERTTMPMPSREIP